jgi:hypothetical protein
LYARAGGGGGGAGGGGGGGGAGPGGSGGDGSSVFGLSNFIFLLAIAVGIFIVFVLQQKQARAIAGKRKRAKQKLGTLSAHDTAFNENVLIANLGQVFMECQVAWCKMDFATLESLLHSQLFSEWKRKLEGMARKGHHDVMDGLRVRSIEFMDVESSAGSQAITVEIKAVAVDRTVDRNGLTVETRPTDFTEYWTFIRQGISWIVFAIRQASEYTGAPSLPSSGSNHQHIDQTPAPAPSTADQRRSELQIALANGDIRTALDRYRTLRNAKGSVSQNQLVKLISELPKHQCWSESILPMRDYISRFREKSDLVRLKLGEILIRREERPAQGLKVLSKVHDSKLSSRLLSQKAKLEAEARKLREVHFELETEEW